jgi:hypothetical protein
VRAINAGAAGANPWPNELGLKQTKFVVRVTARWFAQGTIPTAPGQEGEAPLAISTAELPRTLLPGEEVKLRVPLNPVTPANVHLPPGRYTVIVALYQELVGTIPGGVITLSVTITP